MVDIIKLQRLLFSEFSSPGPAAICLPSLIGGAFHTFSFPLLLRFTLVPAPIPSASISSSYLFIWSNFLAKPEMSDDVAVIMLRNRT